MNKMKHDLESILEAVCGHFKMTPCQLFYKTRKREVVTPRQIYFYFCKKYSGSTYAKIGNMAKRYGRILGFDHATVLHSEVEIKNKLYIGEKEIVGWCASIEESLISHAYSKIRIMPTDVDLVTIAKNNVKYRENSIN